MSNILNRKNKGAKLGLAIMYGGVFFTIFFVVLIMETDSHGKMELFLNFFAKIGFAVTFFGAIVYFYNLLKNN